MMISHIALWAVDLEGTKLFYETYFGARANGKYENPKKGFESYFLSFDSGIRLEIMRKKDVGFARYAVEGGSAEPTALEERDRYVAPDHTGYCHLAFSAGSEAAVDALTNRLAEDGFPVLSGPRRTGDGYYESVVADPEGNLVEITV
jgi:lactoylglutathione lyase